MKLRRLLFHLHLYTGLAAGLLVSLTGLTGSLLVFSHEIDALLYPAVYHVAPPAVPGERLAPEAILERLQRLRPGVKVQSLMPPRDAHDPYEVRVKGDTRLYLNPYTGALLAERSATDHPIGFLFSLHTKLLSGENGKNAVGIGGLLLLLMGGTGVVLWWPGKSGVREGFTIRWGASWKRINFDLHRVGGIVTVLLLSLIALTGAAMVWPEPVTDWTYRLTGTRAPRKPASAVRPGVRPRSLDELLARADAALPGAVTTRITPAAKPTAAVVIRKKLPQELHPNGMSAVYLDQYSGAVLRIDNALQAQPAARVLNLRYPLHIGQYGGWPVRVLYVLVGLTPLLLFSTGCLMWWNRVWIPRRRRALRVGGNQLSIKQ